MKTQQHTGKELEAPASLNSQQTVPQEKVVPAQIFQEPPQRPLSPGAPRWIVISAVILVLALLLSLGFILIPDLIQRPGSQVKPTQSPTAPGGRVTPTPGTTPTPMPGFTVYMGNGYSISSPQEWKVTPSDQEVTFTGASGLYNLTIMITPNQGGTADARAVADASIAAAKEQMTTSQMEPLPAMTTVGGENWVQESISGTETSDGQSVDLQFVVISINHPAYSANTQNFTIVYGTEKSLFAMANTSYFQQMLRSFTFT